MRFGKLIMAGACLAVASSVAMCVVDASAPQNVDGFAARRFSGTPAGEAHAFVAAESPPQAFAFRPALPGDSNRPVIVHYFPPYPLTIGGYDAENDYYAKHYLRREGENGKFAAFGGLLRERPLPGPRANQQARSDFRIEVARAARIGVDVFAVDLLKLDGRFANVVTALLEAAQEADPRFRIAIQPDMTSLRTVTLDQLVESLLRFARHPAAFHDAQGRLVVMPFRAELRPPEFWKGLVDRMAQGGEPIALVPYFINPGRSGKYAAFSAATARGITGDARAGLAQATFGRNAKFQGYPAWIASAAPQDFRAKYGFVSEAEGSWSFTQAIRAGINGGANGLHIMTWNDYGEGTELQPSTATRFGYYDIAAYYISWFKTGIQPPIERDGFVGLHRKQVFRPANTTLGKPWRVHGNPIVDIVEMTAFLTAPAELTITTGGRTFKERADAGLHRFTAPAAVGTVSMSIVRQGQVIAACRSPWTIEPYPDRQDPIYAGFSSLRGCR